MGSQAECLAYLEGLLRHELAVAEASSSVERLSIALGVVELALTPKDAAKQAWPANLPAAVEQMAAAFDAFVAELAASPALAAPQPAAAKVKAVADAVWAKLQKGSYSKDLQHAQHVTNFAAALLPGGPPPGVKRQLDCAGVVTTVYSLCQALSQRFPQHADLAAARMQVSEDHCWLQLGAGGGQETSVEVTTDTAAKRGLPVAEDAWRAWLYTGGAAVLCTPHQALAALVTSLNPAISGGKKGTDSEELQAVQKALLELLLAEHPEALYPAALCALADLREVFAQDELDAARDRGDAAEVERLLHRRPGDAQDLFERAVRLAAGGSAAAAVPAAAADGPAEQQGAPAAANGHDGAAAPPVAEPLPADGNGSSSSSDSVGGQWYPFSYLAAFKARQAEFLASCAAALPAGPQQEAREQPAEQPAEHPYWRRAVAAYGEALQWAGRGGAVLSRYRFQPATDDQLFKDVEGVLEEVFRDGLTALAKRTPGAPLADPRLFQPLLQLWDGVCHLYSGRAKPQAWVALLLRLAKLFSPEARAAAAAAAAPALTSGPMCKVQGLWRELKPAETLRQQFEAADVEGGGGERSAKRRRG